MRRQAAGSPSARREPRRRLSVDQPLPERAISDLVVVLEEVDERDRRQMSRRLAARLAPRSPRPDRRSPPRGPGRVAATGRPRSPRSSLPSRRSRARGRRCGSRRSTRPCRGIGAPGPPFEQVRDVAVVLGREVHLPVGEARAHRSRQLHQKLAVATDRRSGRSHRAAARRCGSPRASRARSR